MYVCATVLHANVHGVETYRHGEGIKEELYTFSK